MVFFAPLGSGLILGSVLKDNSNGAQGIMSDARDQSPGWLHARREPYLLYYHSALFGGVFQRAQTNSPFHLCDSHLCISDVSIQIMGDRMERKARKQKTRLLLVHITSLSQAPPTLSFHPTSIQGSIRSKGPW